MAQSDAKVMAIECDSVRDVQEQGGNWWVVQLADLGTLCTAITPPTITDMSKRGKRTFLELALAWHFWRKLMPTYPCARDETDLTQPRCSLSLLESRSDTHGKRQQVGIQTRTSPDISHLRALSSPMSSFFSESCCPVVGWSLSVRLPRRRPVSCLQASPACASPNSTDATANGRRPVLPRLPRL